MWSSTTLHVAMLQRWCKYKYWITEAGMKHSNKQTSNYTTKSAGLIVDMRIGNLKNQTILWYLLHTKNMHRLVWCRTVFSNKTKTYHGSPWRRQRWLSHPDACKCYLLRCRIWSRSLRWLHTIQNTADTVGTGVMSKGLGQKFSRGLGINETKKRIGFNVSK